MTLSDEIIQKSARDLSPVYFIFIHIERAANQLNKIIELNLSSASLYDSLSTFESNFFDSQSSE